MVRTQRKTNMVILGLLSLAGIAFGSSWSLGANNLAGLRGVDIRPYGDFTIDPGETLLMTLEGDYFTYAVAVRGAWRITKGEDLGWLTQHCDASKTCEFQAGDQGGQVHMYAEANGKNDEAVITIRKPAPPKKVVNPFSDAIPDWAGEPIVELKNSNIIRGYDDGRYGAGDLLTRGQLVTIFYRVLTQLNLIAPSNCTQVYKDIPLGHYAYPAACALRSKGWLDSLSTLNPNDEVSRGETASLLTRIVGSALLEAHGTSLFKVTEHGAVFSDVPKGHMYFTDTAVTRTLGIMKGQSDGMFAPTRTLNRAEAATVFFRVMKVLQEKKIRSL